MSASFQHELLDRKVFTNWAIKTFGIWTQDDGILPSLQPITKKDSNTILLRHGARLRDLLQGTVCCDFGVVELQQKQIEWISVVLLEIFGSAVRSSNKSLWALLPIDVTHTTTRDAIIESFYESKRISLEDALEEEARTQICEEIQESITLEEARALVERTQTDSDEFNNLELPFSTVDSTYEVCAGPTEELPQDCTQLLLDIEQETAEGSHLIPPDTVLPIPDVTALCSSVLRTDVSFDNFLHEREEMYSLAHIVAPSSPGFTVHLERTVTELLFTTPTQKPTLSFGNQASTLRYVDATNSSNFTPLAVSDSLAQPHDQSGGCYHYFHQGLRYDMWPSFFAPHLVAPFKQWMFNQCPLWREYRKQRGTTAPVFVGRLYNWFGLNGFGYNGVWIEPNPFSAAISQLIGHIRSIYAHAQFNGCLVACYPPSDPLHENTWHNQPLKGMDWHQDTNRHLGDSSKVTVFGTTFFIDPNNPTADVSQSGWYLAVAEAANGTAGKVLFKLPLTDNSFCLQPQGAQVKTFHGVEGQHCPYWRVILTFRFVVDQLAEEDRLQNFPITAAQCNKNDKFEEPLKLRSCREYANHNNHQQLIRGDQLASKPKRAKVTKITRDNREARNERFSWVKTIQKGGYYCLGCKTLVDDGSKAENISCSGACRTSLNYGTVPVPLGSFLPKIQLQHLIKRNPYGCLHGGQNTGTCSVLMGPEYENNVVWHCFDPNDPRIILSGIGGRKEDPNGIRVQAYNQIEWQNRGLMVSCERRLPFRLCIVYPWEKGNHEWYLYLGLWYVDWFYYRESKKNNSTKGFMMFNFILRPWSEFKEQYLNWVKTKPLLSEYKEMVAVAMIDAGTKTKKKRKQKTQHLNALGSPTSHLSFNEKVQLFIKFTKGLRWLYTYCVNDKQSWVSVDEALNQMRTQKSSLQFPDPGNDVIIPTRESKNPTRRFRFPERNLDPRLMYAKQYFATIAMSASDIVWMVVIFEMVANTHTFHRYGGIPAPKEWSKFLIHIQDLKTNKISVFANEYQPLSEKKLTEAHQYLQLHLKKLTKSLDACRSLHTALQLVQKIPAVGPFYGAKIVLLLRDLGIIHDCDDASLLGPGSTFMLQWLYLEQKSQNIQQSMKELFTLLTNRTQEFNYSFYHVEDLENALCEFHKWATLVDLPGYKFILAKNSNSSDTANQHHSGKKMK